MAVIRKWMHRPWTFILWTSTNQNASSCTKVYCIIVPQTGKIKTHHPQRKFIAELLRGCEKLCSTEEDTSEYSITEQKDKGNEVTYDVPDFNVSSFFECRRKILTYHIKERTWPLQEMNTLRKFLTIWNNISIVTAIEYPVKIPKKLFSASWNNNKKKSNVTTII